MLRAFIPFCVFAGITLLIYLAPLKIKSVFPVSCVELLLVFVALIALSPIFVAKQIYKWTDAAGVLHFSDAPPADKAAAKGLTARLIDVDPQAPVRVRQEEKSGSAGSVAYFAYNDLAGPVSLSFEFTEANGVITEPTLPALITLPAKREIPAFVVRASPNLAPGTGGSYSLRYKWTPGDPAATPDLAAIYQWPFRAGLAFAVHQAFGGEFSHSSPENFHAVDLALPQGTDVLAARAGVVMQVQDDFHRCALHRLSSGWWIGRRPSSDFRLRNTASSSVSWM